MLIDYLSWTFIGIGIFFGLTSAIGLLRLPDLFTRVHAAGVSDTLCAAFIIFGLILQAGLTLISIKLVFIILLLWFTSPISSHSLVKAAYHSGIKPYEAHHTEKEQSSS